MCWVPLEFRMAMAKVKVKITLGVMMAIIACGFGEQRDELQWFSCFEALYFSWPKEAVLGKEEVPQKFEMPESGMMLEQKMSFGFAELYVKDLRDCRVVDCPGFFESNDNEMKECKATPYLHKEKTCKAYLNLQEVNGTKDVCKANPYLQENEIDENHYKETQYNFVTLSRSLENYDIEANTNSVKFLFKNYVVENEFLTLGRSSVKYVIKIFGWWTLAIMNKVYVIMSPQWIEGIVALFGTNPALELVLHYVKDNFNYLLTCWTL